MSDIIIFGNPYSVKTVLQHVMRLSADSFSAHFIMGNLLSSLWAKEISIINIEYIWSDYLPGPTLKVM